LGICLRQLMGGGSGVTRVGVTRGGNWRVSPFFPEKAVDLFSHRRHFSSVLYKFSQKIIFTSGINPWMVSPGAVRPCP